MRGIPILVTAIAIVVAGCTSGGTRATIPQSIPSTVSTVAATTTTTSATTTTTVATTTTVDRIAEIEAIFQDLEERRLKALYEGDVEAFKALFANEEYMQRSLVLFDLMEFESDWQVPTVLVLEVLHEDSVCIAVRTATDFSTVLVGGGIGEVVEVVEAIVSGWGISYAGEGWACDGPHPFSP